MRFLREPVQIIRADLRVYLIMNVIMYGSSLAGFVTALIFPDLNATQVASLENDGTADLVVSLLNNVWLFALVILGVNTLTVGVLSILLPSMIVPFAGVAIFAYQAFEPFRATWWSRTVMAGDQVVRRCSWWSRTSAAATTSPMRQGQPRQRRSALKLVLSRLLARSPRQRRAPWTAL